MALVKSNRKMNLGRKLKQRTGKKKSKYPYEAVYTSKKRTGAKEEKSATKVFFIVAT